MTIDSKTIQGLIAYLAIVFGVLTTQPNTIHLSPLASAILGVFGVLLHPDTSITVPTTPTPAPLLAPQG